MVKLVGVAAILLMIAPMKAKPSAGDHGILPRTNHRESAFSKQNPNCSSGVDLRIDGNI